MTIKLPTGPFAPIYHRLPVAQPVAFLTMDDGLVRLPQAIQLMQAAGIPFTMFLIAPVAASDPPFFWHMEEAGGVSRTTRSRTRSCAASRTPSSATRSAA